MPVPRAVLGLSGKGLRFLWSLRRFGAARAVLWAILALWGFDRAVYFVTQAQWFESLGMEQLWRARCLAQCGLFFGFSFFGGVLTRVFLGAVASIDARPQPLRGALARFEPLRSRVSRLSWCLAGAAILVLARGFARVWSDFGFWHGAASGSRYFGLPSALWTQFLPVFEPFLRSIWAFSLWLFVLVAATGVLRALPLLAARESVAPPVLGRVLWRLAAWISGLRALLYATQILDLAQGRALQSGDVFLLTPIFGMGLTACFLLAIEAFGLSKTRFSRRRGTRWTLAMLGALILPGILAFVSAPARAIWPETAWLREARVAATQRAWQLDFRAQNAVARPLSPEVAWPVWDEKSLLSNMGGARRSNGRIVAWQSATLGFDSQNWGAIVAGQSAGAETPTTGRSADQNTALALENLRFWPDGAITRTPLEGAPAFFGFDGPALFGDENGGVSIRSTGQKWLWAWRLRDVLLPFDGENTSRLLLFRGARERAAQIAPFWKVCGEPQLVSSGKDLFWWLDLSDATSHSPGAMSASSGEMAGLNTAGDALKMRLDARSGAVTFWIFSSRQVMRVGAFAGILHDASKNPEVRASWRAAPEILRAQFELYESLRGENGGEPRGIGPAQRGIEAPNQTVTRVFEAGKRQITLLEAPDGTQKRGIWRGALDFDGRLGALDAALSRGARPALLETQAGDPFVWSDAGAPGGFWIGRAVFAAPRPPVGPGDENAKIWRVALTGAAPKSKVGVGASVRAATLDFLGRNAPPLAPALEKQLPLAVRALRAHDAAQIAARAGKWALFDSESQRERQILEELAARGAH